MDEITDTHLIEANNYDSLLLIESDAQALVDHIRGSIPQYATDMRALWTDLKGNFPKTDIGYNTITDSEISKFAKAITDLGHDFQQGESLTDVCNRLFKLKILDFVQIAGFLGHDVLHTNPSAALMELLIAFDRTRKLTNDGKSNIILEEDYTTIDTFIDSIEDLADLYILPLEFTVNVLRAKRGEAVPTERVNLNHFFTKIAQLVAMRFASDSYQIDNGQATHDQENLNKNRFIIDVDPDLVIDINKSMLFGIVYNLVKNAAKANKIMHFEEKSDPFLSRFPGSNTELKNPKSITLKVNKSTEGLEIICSDEGIGIALDDSLNRFKVQFQQKLEKQSKQEILMSEWFLAIESMVGKVEANSLFDWSDDPFQLRQVKLGTIFDLLFVAGFEMESWQKMRITSGMGLWGVRHITNSLKGELKATNIFNGGALFSIKIPLNRIGLEQDAA